MELFTDEWREASNALHEPLREFMENADSARYSLGSRFVTIKHRLRKDRVAVDSIGCWLSQEENKPPLKIWFKTTAMLQGSMAEQMAKELISYLHNGERPKMVLETYPGYEDFLG